MQKASDQGPNSYLFGLSLADKAQNSGVAHMALGRSKILKSGCSLCGTDVKA